MSLQITEPQLLTFSAWFGDLEEAAVVVGGCHLTLNKRSLSFLR